MGVEYRSDKAYTVDEDVAQRGKIVFSAKCLWKSWNTLPFGIIGICFQVPKGLPVIQHSCGGACIEERGKWQLDNVRDNFRYNNLIDSFALNLIIY